MIKTFLLTITTLLFLTSSTLAGALNFSHASVIIVCNNLEGAVSIFETAQNKQPDVTVIGCYGDRSFGNPIHSAVKKDLNRISAIMSDWEGDPFALFEVRDQNIWLIIYNPDNLNQEAENS